MQQFSAEYLTETRRGMWDTSRQALAPLQLERRDRILDVGCGTGELTRVLAEESSADLLGLDADRSLLLDARQYAPVIVADGTRLPVRDAAADLVVCQALLINLPDPVQALAEFRRVSTDTVAAIEPDNQAVTITSTVDGEAALAARTRQAYLSGLAIDGSVTADTIRQQFATADLTDIRIQRHDHVRTVAPPYSERALSTARRQATGQLLEADRSLLLSGSLSEQEYDTLRERWRTVGREIVTQMQADEYRRREVVPWHVTVGQVS